MITDQCYLYFPSQEEQYIQRNKDITRFIYGEPCIYTEAEKKLLSGFHTYMSKHEQTQIDDDKALRFLQASKNFNSDKNDYQKTMASLKQYEQQLNARNVNNLSPESKQLLEKGVLYTCGRDESMRPIIVFDMEHALLKTDAEVAITLETFIYFQSYVVKELLLPGQIEQWVYIFDFRKQPLFSLPLLKIGNMFKVLLEIFKNRNYKIYLLNCPGAFTFIWAIMKPFIDEATRSKVSFCSDSIDPNIFSHVPKSQLPERYGGCQKKIDHYWPVTLLNAYEPKSLILQEEYINRHERKLLKNNRINYNLLENKIIIDTGCDTDEHVVARVIRQAKSLAKPF